MEFRELFWQGAWQRPADKTLIQVENPATETPCGVIPRGRREDVDAAVAAARAALPAWSARSPVERGGYLARLREKLAEKAEEMARVITTEVGTPIKLSQRVQVGNPLASLEIFAELASQGAPEERLGHSLITREPVGVVACITPWNFPLHQIVAKVGAALAAGCTVVVKPSEVAPLNAFLLAGLCQEIDLPPGVFNLVSGFGPEVGEALVSHPGVDAVSFTGSTRAGRRVAALAAEGIKRVSLELGGKSAALLLPDLAGEALANAVKACVSMAYFNSGQTCSALTRLLAPAHRLDEVTEAAVAVAQGFGPGDPFAPGTRLGPLVSAAQRERVRQFVAGARAEGCTLVSGGEQAPADLPTGYYFQPTVFTRVGRDTSIAREEIFGPVLSILAYDGVDDGVALANGTPYGLAAAVWGPDEDAALAVARRLRAGQVDINGAPFNPRAPFGGFGQSGYGRELGAYGIEEFFELKSIQQRSTRP